MANYRNATYLRLVASLPCIECGIEGASQAAHANSPVFGKGMGIKAHDWATFPLCHAGACGCHERHDQRMADMSKSDRIDYEWEMIGRTLAGCLMMGRLVIAK